MQAGKKINDLYENARIGTSADEELLFKSLVTRFRLFVRHRIRSREDTEDIVQDSMAIIIREFKEMTFEVSFSAWAYKVLNNKIMSYIKKRGHEASKAERLKNHLENSAIPLSTPDLRLRDKLLNCLGKIGAVNRRYARILNLRHQGYQTEEICERFEIGRDNLYGILCRARTMLEKCLDTGEIR